MCGITGILKANSERVEVGELKPMTDAIQHRGPDDEGWFVDGSVGLGHRRLSIIDLSDAGHQPMTTADGRYTISYNGEVYNFAEIRKELEKAGVAFRSRTDTEVVLYAYAVWGVDCLTRFNGMFAFAIWDRNERELFLARDRYGIKPLYYSRQNGSFVFGSEVKAILAHPHCSAGVDLEAMLEYFTFQNYFTDRTLFKDVSLMPPGSWVKLSKPEQVHFQTYWDYEFVEPEKDEGEGAYLEELDRLFQQAVERQLVSDVDVGCYLSGGMDSGSITAIAARKLPYLTTCTCGFDLHSASGLELNFDERERAEYMSYLFKTEHYEMVLKAGDMERCMPKLVHHLEEPRVGQSYPNFYAAQLASKFVKVVLAGTGGDELFGGYPWRYYRAVVNDDFEHYIDKYYLFWQRLMNNRDIRQVFAPIWDQVEHVWTRDLFRDVFKRRLDRFERPEDYVNHSLYFEAKTFLHGLLVVEDKLSMAHGLESRVPFLDNDLVDFAMRLPVRYKLGKLGDVVRLNENEPGLKTKKYFQKTRDGKLLLRTMMQRYIPEVITTSEKQGFSAPDASWFRGDSIDYIKDLLLNKTARIYAYLDPVHTHGLLEEHFSGQKNRRLLIWSLICFEAWLGTYLT